MKPEEINKAIAEACGWTQIEDRSQSLMMSPGLFIFGYPPNNAIINRKLSLPDFSKSLDAMAEARKTLTVEEQVEFVLRLNEIVRREKPVGDGLHAWEFINATAAQHTEAFLRAKGLWKESTP